MDCLSVCALFWFVFGTRLVAENVLFGVNSAELATIQVGTPGNRLFSWQIIVGIDKPCELLVSEQ